MIVLVVAACLWAQDERGDLFNWARKLENLDLSVDLLGGNARSLVRGRATLAGPPQGDAAGGRPRGPNDDMFMMRLGLAF
jgi:hypothetical protein